MYSVAPSPPAGRFVFPKTTLQTGPQLVVEPLIDPPLVTLQQAMVVIFVDNEIEQAFASVTTKEYDPAVRLQTVAELLLLFHK